MYATTLRLLTRQLVLGLVQEASVVVIALCLVRLPGVLSHGLRGLLALRQPFLRHPGILSQVILLPFLTPGPRLLHRGHASLCHASLLPSMGYAQPHTLPGVFPTATTDKPGTSIGPRGRRRLRARATEPSRAEGLRPRAANV